MRQHDSLTQRQYTQEEVQTSINATHIHVDRRLRDKWLEVWGKAQNVKPTRSNRTSQGSQSTKGLSAMLLGTPVTSIHWTNPIMVKLTEILVSNSKNIYCSTQILSDTLLLPQTLSRISLSSHLYSIDLTIDEGFTWPPSRLAFNPYKSHLQKTTRRLVDQSFFRN